MFKINLYFTFDLFDNCISFVRCSGVAGPDFPDFENDCEGLATSPETSTRFILLQVLHHIIWGNYSNIFILQLKKFPDIHYFIYLHYSPLTLFA